MDRYKHYIKDYAYLFLMGAIIITVDQLSKAFIRAHLAEGAMWAPWDWLLPYARIVNWHNSGVAFGMFQNQGYISAILAIGVALLIIYFFPRVPSKEWLLRLALGFQLGGALGNVVDRFTRGNIVTDFISIGNFPVWNVADGCITVGVGLLILSVWLQERRDKAQKQKAAAVLQITEDNASPLTAESQSPTSDIPEQTAQQTTPNPDDSQPAGG